MVNKAILIGRCGGTPEARTVGESKVVNFSMATTETFKDKNGEKQEKTQWHRITAWRGLAGVIESYVTKGMLIYIEGRIEYREYEVEGVKKYATDIIASEMKMLSKKDETGKRDPTSGETPEPIGDDSGLPF